MKAGGSQEGDPTLGKRRALHKRFRVKGGTALGEEMRSLLLGKIG
jgi:hypothetical protein